jgi:hypothetical protein
VCRHAVQAADAVQDRAANLMLGVGLQLDVELRIEIINGVDQADNAD